MARKFISLIIAASIAVTGLTAAPAQASDRDLARALAAIAGVAIIGAAIHENKKSKRRAAQRQYYQPQYYQPKRKHYAQPGQRALDRAYRQGVSDHRNLVRERRHERRSERRAHRRGYDQDQYSARPYRRGY